jgi:DNA-binding CsgD family transcriptional regulator/tetratricopeptide (TPR) repeat protein
VAPHIELLVGRTTETSAIRGVAEQALAGQPSIVLISGAAGLGKTALVRSLSAVLAPFVVVRAPADELATEVPMAVIDQLTPISTQAPFAAGLELLDYLAERQSEGPVAIIVEDAHWADPESRQALIVALRRLDLGDRVLTIVTTRPELFAADEGWARLRDDARCLHIDLDPLTVAEVGELAGRAGIQLGATAAAALHRHTMGHPLYVRTLLRELTADQLRAGGVLPAPRSLAASTVAVVAALPRPAASLVTALAVAGGTADLSTLAQIAALDDPTGAAAAAVPSGLIEWSSSAAGQMLTFAHPLYRTAVYDDLTPSQRRALHLAAARVSADSTAALWHRVAAADRADEVLAEALDDAAAAAAARNDAALAGRFLTAASDLSESATPGMRRLLTAAEHHLGAGQIAFVRRLQPRLEAAFAVAGRDLILGWLAWHAGDYPRAERWLRAAASTDDHVIRGRALVLLAGVYAFQSRGHDAMAAGREALAIGADLPERDERRAWLMIVRGMGQSEGGVRALAMLRERFPDPWHDLDQMDPLLLRARAALHLFSGESADAVTWFDLALANARRGELDEYLAHVHVMRSQAHHRTGAWDRALSDAHRAVEIATDLDQPWVMPQAHAMAARLHGALGHAEAAAEHVQLARYRASSVSSFEIIVLLATAEATIADAAGRSDDVVTALSPLAAEGGGQLAMAENLQFWSMLIGALIDSERFDEARTEVDHFRHAAADRLIDVTVPLLTADARLAAAAGDADAALAMYSAAEAAVTDNTEMFDRLVLHRHHGHLLRRMGRRQQAADQLRAGLELATAVGAVSHRQRIEAEIGEVGLEARSEPKRRFDLTDREHDVAALVRRGLTNKEVAASLYVSSKAVEYHLGNIYAKLGISSRRELREMAPA